MAAHLVAGLNGRVLATQPVAPAATDRVGKNEDKKEEKSYGREQ